MNFPTFVACMLAVLIAFPIGLAIGTLIAWALWKFIIEKILDKIDSYDKSN